MARLHREVIGKGREYVIQGSIEEFFKWCRDYTPNLKSDVVEDTFSKVWIDERRRLKLFEAMVNQYDTMDPIYDLIRIVFKGAIYLGLICGVLGGALYLLDRLF